MRCQVRVSLPLLITSIILLTNFSTVKTKFNSEIDNEMLKELSAKLTPVQCWLISSYLGQKTSDPVKTGKEIAHIGGHATNFKCYEALHFWRESDLPISGESNEIRVKGYEKRVLARAVSFAGRTDLQPWIAAWSSDKSFTDFNLVPASVASNTQRNNDMNLMSMEGEINQGTKSETQKALEDLIQFQKDYEFVQFPELKFTEEDADFMEKSSNTRDKKRIDSQTEFYSSILKYVVVSVIAFVMVCFAVTTLMLCIRDRPAVDRRRIQGHEIQDPDQFIDDYYGHSGVSAVFRKNLQVKEQQDRAVGAVIVDLNGNNGNGPDDNNNA